MNTLWRKPDLSAATPYRRLYIERVPEGDLPNLLETNLRSTIKLLQGLSAEKLNYRYAPGKWSIPQILLHVCDTERIFSYRILCIARGDKTPLPGYEENDYARESDADNRDMAGIIAEFTSIRLATLDLLRSLSARTIDRTGTSNNQTVSVRELAYMMAGHELHHLNVIKEKYLNK